MAFTTLADSLPSSPPQRPRLPTAAIVMPWMGGCGDRLNVTGTGCGLFGEPGAAMLTVACYDEALISVLVERIVSVAGAVVSLGVAVSQPDGPVPKSTVALRPVGVPGPFPVMASACDADGGVPTVSETATAAGEITMLGTGAAATSEVIGKLSGLFGAFAAVS